MCNYNSWITKLFRNCYVKMSWKLKVLTFVMNASILWQTPIFVHKGPTVKLILLVFCSDGLFFKYFCPQLQPQLESAVLAGPRRSLWLMQMKWHFHCFSCRLSLFGFVAPLPQLQQPAFPRRNRKDGSRWLIADVFPDMIWLECGETLRSTSTVRDVRGNLSKWLGNVGNLPRSTISEIYPRTR